jgi:hypothetical protein
MSKEKAVQGPPGLGDQKIPKGREARRRRFTNYQHARSVDFPSGLCSAIGSCARRARSMCVTARPPACASLPSGPSHTRRIRPPRHPGTQRIPQHLESNAAASENVHQPTVRAVSDRSQPNCDIGRACSGTALATGLRRPSSDRLTCAPCQGGAFQWVQAPPGNRSSRKQPEQSWR